MTSTENLMTATPAQTSLNKAPMPSPTFIRKDLKPDGFFGKLFGPRKVNALMELNNVLADAKDVRQVMLETVDGLNQRYKTDIHRKFRSELAELYRTFLRDCLQDRVFTEDEVNQVWHLKALFGISDKEHERLYQAEAVDAYKADLNAVLKDSNVTVSEKLGLEKLSAYLQIPEETRSEAFDGIVKPFLQARAAQITADNQLSPEEEDEFNALCRSLGVTPTMSNASAAALSHMRVMWRINNGELQSISVPINLQRGEECYYSIDVAWHEYRKLTRRVSYGGPSLRIKIVQGVYWNAGSYGVERQSEDVLTPIDSGTLYLTNKRLIFDGIAKNQCIRLSKILDIIRYKDGIGIEKDAGKSPVLIIRDVRSIPVVTAMLARLIRDFA
jgi:hypothetical protein